MLMTKKIESMRDFHNKKLRWKRDYQDLLIDNMNFMFFLEIKNAKTKKQRKEIADRYDLVNTTISILELDQ